MSNDTAQIVDINPTLRIRIEYDRDVESPAEWDNVGQIAYYSHRECLGTENVTRDRMDEIATGIRDGSLIGMAVYAYVHSGVTIATTPFSCQWDSGQSGFIYTTKEKAIAEFGKKLMTAAVKEKTLKCLQGEVETFDQYLQGDVYGFILERVVRDDEGDEDGSSELDSCWGFYGQDYCLQEARASAECQVLADEKEALESTYWADRGVATEVA